MFMHTPGKYVHVLSLIGSGEPGFEASPLENLERQNRKYDRPGRGINIATAS